MNLSAPKSCFVFLFLTVFSFTSAQTIEKETVNKSCECIQSKLKELTTIKRDDVSQCITKSFDTVLKSKPEKEAKNYMRDMNLVVEKARQVYKTVAEKCLPR